jgi:16S rRNA G966 N2-methylase RsmD
MFNVRIGERERGGGEKFTYIDTYCVCFLIVDFELECQVDLIQNNVFTIAQRQQSTTSTKTTNFGLNFDTILMNPPFGTRNKGLNKKCVC